MQRAEWLACLSDIDRTQAWVLRQAGAHHSAADEWFGKDGPGVPPDLAAWLRAEVAFQRAHRAAHPIPPPEVWRRDTRGGNPRLRQREDA